MSYKTDLQGNNTDLQTVLSKVNALPSGSALGDATAADVVQGKTFSSASGIKVSGTLVPTRMESGSVTTTNTRKLTIPNLSKYNNALISLIPDLNAGIGIRSKIVTIHKQGNTHVSTYVDSNALYSFNDTSVSFSGDDISTGFSFPEKTYVYVLYD